MNNEAGDDKVIATAFRRSIAVVAGLAVLVGLIFGVRLLSRPDAEIPIEAPVIAPQSNTRLDQPEPPLVMFTDITRQAGINHTHQNGAYGDRLLPETMGGGVAFLDFNNDQIPDLLFVNGRDWPWRNAGGNTSSLLLYMGEGDADFVDITVSSGLSAELYGMGATVGDYDRDGYVDIFVSALGENRLYRNDRGLRFEDVTLDAGVGGEDDAWSTGAAFVDVDGDDDLDLFVLNYVQWSREVDFEVDYRLTGIGRAYGPPNQYAGTHSYLYINNGDGTFSDSSAAAGIQIDNASTGLPLGKGLAVLPIDVDGNRLPDLIVANDTVRNFLFVNEGGGRFTESGVELGIAFDNNGSATGAMGIDDTWLAPTGDVAVAIGNFANEMTSFYVRPPGAAVFTDQAIVSGIGPASRQALTFGLVFLDYDLDGRPDMLQANGHVENEIDVIQPSQDYAQQPQLFWNCGASCTRQFVPVALNEGNALAIPIVGRGAAYADIDSDGDQDIVLTQIGAAPKLLRNDQSTGHNWIQFDVFNKEGVPAYGATVEIVTAGGRQTLRIEPTRSYLSQVSTTLTFGIGEDDSVERVIVEWPDGQQTVTDGARINHRHRIYPDTKKP